MITPLLTIIIVFTVIYWILLRIYFIRYFKWEIEQRRGMNYYGKSLEERRKVKETIRFHAGKLRPMIWAEARIREIGKTSPPIPSIVYEGVTGPSYSCSVGSFEKAHRYQASSDDVFVVTQMKCGTTWMQQVVYETLCHGKGVIGEHGNNHLYALSPWLEALDGVPLEEAPKLGVRGKRLIKTHMPVSLCPYSESAKYIYVARHPVSCFASILDYYRLMSGPLCIPKAKILDWYCSDAMWWTPWPEHVAAWWDKSFKSDNVLFIHFEEMKLEPEVVIKKVSEFLGENLTEDQREAVLTKSSFDYMKLKEEFYEMSPPNLFSVSGTYFKSGSAHRHHDIEEADKERIIKFVHDRLNGSSYPIDQHYPDLAVSKA